MPHTYNTRYTPPDGYHMHKCPCGHVWEHCDSMAGDTPSHTCSNCGNEVWHKYYGRENPCERMVCDNPAPTPVRDDSLEEFFQVIELILNSKM